MKTFIVITSVVLAASCSSRKFKKDYEVVDASHKEIPEWLNEPREWADDVDDPDHEKSRYYVYTTEPKNSKSTACEIAKARAASVIADEISQFIKQSFATSTHGDPTAGDSKLSQYVEDNLAKEVQTFVVGAKVHRTYWEKQRFLKEKGAAKDYDGYTCSALLKISKDNLDVAFNRANQKLAQKAKNPDTKAKVAKAIEEAQEAYEKQQ